MHSDRLEAELKPLLQGLVADGWSLPAAGKQKRGEASQETQRRVGREAEAGADERRR